MPEGPEVFLTAKKYRATHIGKTLVTLKTADVIPVNSIVNSIETKGKKLWFNLENQMCILFSFALEGEFRPYGGVEGSKLIAELTFTDETLSFVDPMRIAKCRYVSKDDLENFLPKGIDPLEELFGMREWLQVCEENKNKLVAAFIVNQSIIAGVGNKYRSEILHLADIDPMSRIKQLTEIQLETILVQVYRVLSAAAREQYTVQVHGLKTDANGNKVHHVKVLKGLYVWSTKKTVN